MSADCAFCNPDRSVLIQGELSLAFFDMIKRGRMNSLLGRMPSIDFDYRKRSIFPAPI